jgi:hypothetical protein
MPKDLRDQEGVRDVLLRHAERYPLWEPDDLYKLIHQGVMGSEHAVTDEVGARSWLIRELAELRPGPDEPLLDPISWSGAIVRIHLRPFASLGLDPEVLVEAFVRTARECRGSPDKVEAGLGDAAHLAGTRQLSFSEDDVRLLISRMGDAGFPAVRHSPAFRSHYRPAYRVVARAFLPGELRSLV